MFDFAVAPDATANTFTAGRVTLTGDCSSGASDLVAQNASSQSAAFQGGFINLAGSHSNPDQDFDSGDADTVGAGGSGSGTASVDFADDVVTTIVFAYQDAGQTGNNCHYWGRVISG